MKGFYNYIPLHLVVFLIIGICIDEFFHVPEKLMVWVNTGSVIIFAVLTATERFRLRTSRIFVFWCMWTVGIIGLNCMYLADPMNRRAHFVNQLNYEEGTSQNLVIQIKKTLRPGRKLPKRFKLRLPTQ